MTGIKPELIGATAERIGVMPESTAVAPAAISAMLAVTGILPS